MHGTAIEDRQVEIRVKIFAEVDIVAAIAGKGTLQVKTRFRMRKQFREDLFAGVRIRFARHVIADAQLVREFFPRDDFRVACIVRFPRPHFFRFRHDLLPGVFVENIITDLKKLTSETSACAAL